MVHSISALLSLTIAFGSISTAAQTAQSPLRLDASADPQISPASTSAPSPIDIVRRLQFKATSPVTTEYYRRQTTTTSTTAAPPRTCSWFGSSCKAFGDGCNYCWCNEDGSHSDCSLNECAPSFFRERRCLECEDGYHLDADTKCVSSGAFIYGESGSASTDHFWVGIAVGIAVCFVMVMAVGIVVFGIMRISGKRSQGASCGNERDSVQLTDDQQLDTVGNTMIELKESLDLDATIQREDTV